MATHTDPAVLIACLPGGDDFEDWLNQQCPLAALNRSANLFCLMSLVRVDRKHDWLLYSSDWPHLDQSAWVVSAWVVERQRAGDHNETAP
jgi:hypothetical protein